MKVAILHASSQKEKNNLLEKTLRKVTLNKDIEIINLGVFASETEDFNYLQIAVAISMLITSKAVDFVVSGCSSGNGMMLACNMLPNLICGYASSPSEAALFGKINAGNVLSYPLGLNFGWAAELNLEYTLEKLFAEPFGLGYPKEDVERKLKDTKGLKQMKKINQRDLKEVLIELDPVLLKAIFQRGEYYQYLMTQGKDVELLKFLASYTS